MTFDVTMVFSLDQKSIEIQLGVSSLGKPRWQCLCNDNCRTNFYDIVACRQFPSKATIHRKSSVLQLFIAKWDRCISSSSAIHTSASVKTLFTQKIRDNLQHIELFRLQLVRHIVQETVSQEIRLYKVSRIQINGVINTLYRQEVITSVSLVWILFTVVVLQIVPGVLQFS